MAAPTEAREPRRFFSEAPEWDISDVTESLFSETPSFTNGSVFSVLISALIIAVSVDEDALPLGDTEEPIDDKAIDTAFKQFYRYPHLPRALQATCAALLGHVGRLHDGSTQDPKSVTTQLRTASDLHLLLRKTCTQRARATAVVCQRVHLEPHLCPLLAELGRHLLSELTSSAATECVREAHDSPLVRRLERWLTRHMSTATAANTSHPEAGGLMTALQDAASLFNFFAVQLLPIPCRTDVRRIPRSMHPEFVPGTDDGDTLVVVRPTHVIQVGAPASDDGLPVTQRLMFHVFVDEAAQASVSLLFLPLPSLPCV